MYSYFKCSARTSLLEIGMMKLSVFDTAVRGFIKESVSSF